MNPLDKYNSMPFITSVPSLKLQEMAAQQPQKKKKNFLTSLISEAGGLGGAAGGAAIGSAILPGLGTLLGAGIGGFIGGTGGRVAENKVRDNRIGIGDALKEGAISGVMSAGPLKLGVLGKEAATGLKAGLSGSQALIKGGEKAAAFSLLKGAGKSIAKEGDALVTKSFRFTPSQLSNFKSKFGEDASQVIKNYGIKKPEEFATKAVEPLTKQFDEIVGAIGTVPRAKVEGTLKGAYQPLINSAVEDKVAVGKSLKSQADALLKKYGNDIDAKELNTLRKEFDSLVTYTDRAANPARYDVNKRAADAIRTALQDTATAKQLPLKEVGKELQKTIQLAENAAKQSNLGRGSLPLGLSNLLGGGVGGSIAGIPGAAGMAATTAAVNSNAGRRAAAKGAQGIASVLEKAGSNQFSLPKVAGRVLQGAAIRNAGSIQAPTGQEDYLSSMMSETNPMNSPSTMTPSTNIDQQYPLDPALSNTPTDTSPFAAENIDDALRQIAENGGGISELSQFLNLAKTYQSLKPKEAATPKLNATQLQQANNSQSALSDLQTIREMLASNPNVNKLNSLPGGNFTKSITGTSNYEAARQNVADAIGRIRSGGAINKDEEKRFLGLLPGAFDSPEVADQKLSRLESLLSQFANPVSSAQDTQTADLASILAGYGQ